jgi:hypothetical protein
MLYLVARGIVVMLYAVDVDVVVGLFVNTPGGRVGGPSSGALALPFPPRLPSPLCATLRHTVHVVLWLRTAAIIVPDALHETNCVQQSGHFQAYGRHR